MISVNIEVFSPFCKDRVKKQWTDRPWPRILIDLSKQRPLLNFFFLHRAHQASIFKYFQNSNFSSLFKTKASAQLFTRTKQVFWSPTTATNQQTSSSSSLTLSSSSEVQLSSQQSAGHRAPDDDEVPVPRGLRQLRVQNLLEKSPQGEIF